MTAIPQRDYCNVASGDAETSSIGTICYGASDIGRVRETNEDRFLFDERLGLFIVCDGMGGHVAGDVAAQTAVVCVAEYVREHAVSIETTSRPGNEKQLEQVASLAVREANREICDLSARSKHLTGMGTTLTMMLVAGRHAAVVHVGDSRLYRLRERRLSQITADHTVVSKIEDPELDELDMLSDLPLRVELTRALGQADTQLDVHLLAIEHGDTFLLCTDGLTKQLNAQTEITTLLGDAQLERAVGTMLSMANCRAGSDNITAVAVRCEDRNHRPE